jgi:alpha-tubulin suppressor-like RCC1 family protein
MTASTERSTVAALSLMMFLALSPAASAASAAVHRWGAFGTQEELQTPGPVTYSGGEGEVVKIDAGNASAYALTADGDVLAWGANEHGQLGNGTTDASFDEVVHVRFPAAVRIVAIGEERASGFAVDSTGHAWAWGEGASGSDCLGKHVEDLTEPTAIPGLAGVAAVQGGATHSIWLMRSGAVMMCGLNQYGELGTGETGGVAYAPVQVPGLTKVVEVSAGQGVACARTSAGVVFDWGDDNQGQVGNGVFESSVATPYQVPLREAATQISCGGNLSKNGSTLALLRGGAVYGWGADEAGQLGDERTANKSSPALARATPKRGRTQVVASGEYSLGLGAQGDVYAWGSNARHALGTVGKIRMSPTPLLVDTGAVEISATAYDSSDRT